jgi:hypothetical protein
VSDLYLISPAEFLRRYDRRRVAQLLADDGVPVEDDELEENETLQLLLLDSTQMLASAVMVGKRYSQDDLYYLAGMTKTGDTYAERDTEIDGVEVPLSPDRHLVRRIISDLVYGELVSRRGYSADEINNLAPKYGLALQQLQLLRDGERIFSTVDQVPETGARVEVVDQTRRTSANSPNLLSNRTRIFGVLERDRNPSCG